jgi:TonB family protein
MTISLSRVILLLGSLGASLLAGQTAVGVIRSRPFPSPQELANLESHVLQNPEDINARVALLQSYLDTAPFPGNRDPGRRSVRLQHILYLVEHHPEAAASASAVAYVHRANGPFADAADHDAVRNQWLAAVQGHPGNSAVTMNAVKFLNVEDKEDAEEALRRAIAADPENRELAANLGFQYAIEILGLDSVVRGAPASRSGPDVSGHARAELEESSNAIVLAAAGTALPNLAVSASGGTPVDSKLFDFAAELSARARKLAPADPDIQGPMPLIRYFAAAQDGTSISFSRIRIGENVQTANLVRKTEPAYPEEARKAGITGQVRFTAIISRDGAIQNLELMSGHPLLVDSARAAAESWRYKPTLLNNAPVEVVTTITVTFPPIKGKL